MTNKRISVTLAAFSMMLATQATVTNGAGFALIDGGAKNVGNAFVGASVSAEDASTVFTNPAGMTRLSGTQISVVGHIVMSSIKFSDGGSKLGATPLTGDQGGRKVHKGTGEVTRCAALPRPRGMRPSVHGVKGQFPCV